jgi:glycosyltransferase involved in cell wall biosynthesis
MEKIKPVLKVLHVHTLPVISGSGINTLDTMRGLLARGYEVEFACAPGGGGLIEEVRKLGIQFRPLNNLVRQVSPVKDIAALFELAALIREHKYSIVHTHNSKAGFIGRLAAKMAGTPIVIHTVHGFAFHDYEKPPLRFLYALLERFAANFSDKLIVVSTPLKDWGLKLKVGQVGQYRVIPDGIDIKRFSVKVNTQEKRKELGLKEDELVVGLAAKLWDGKGHEVLIQAIP